MNLTSIKNWLIGNQPGSWLFYRSTLQWMSEPALKQQLPFLMWLFANYSSLYFKIFQVQYLFLGRSLLLWIISLRNILSAQSYLQLELTNYTICLDLSDLRFLQVVNELNRADADTKILSHLLSAGDTFIDIGANHGSFSLVASKIVGASGYIVAVEPQSRLAKAVEQSLAANAECDYRVYHTAVGNFDGEIELLIPDDTSGAAGIYAAHSGTHKYKIEKVSMQRFDELIDGQDFAGKTTIKLDIEGSESAFLLGARQTITALKPDLILEVHPGSLKASGTTGENLKHLLQEVGYQQYAELNNLEDILPLDRLNTQIQRNIVVFRDR